MVIVRILKIAYTGCCIDIRLDGCLRILPEKFGESVDIICGYRNSYILQAQARSKILRQVITQRYIANGR
jgi:hypothetical protein